jgi:predicted enzyme related to lactoylglutathione lyase
VSQTASAGLAPAVAEAHYRAFTFNYRVDDLDALLASLRAAGIELLKGPESHENGKFAWIADPDGNKLELWEPKLWDEKNKAG